MSKRIANLKKDQAGFTLMEVVVALVIIGILLPATLALFGEVTEKSVKNSVLERATLLAEQKLEEIIGYKEKHWQWYQNPGQFADSEHLGNGFQRVVTVSSFSNWGNANIDGWKVDVTIIHPQLDNGYKLQVRLTKYYEE